MNFDTYTDRSKGFIQSAQGLALREGHQKFTPEHLLKVVLDDAEGLASGLIDKAGGNSRAALAGVEQALAAIPKVSGSGAGQVYLSPELARVFESAQKIADKAGDKFVTVERLLTRCAFVPTSMLMDCLANGQGFVDPVKFCPGRQSINIDVGTKAQRVNRLTSVAFQFPDAGQVHDMNAFFAFVGKAVPRRLHNTRRTAQLVLHISGEELLNHLSPDRYCELSASHLFPIPQNGQCLAAVIELGG